MASVFFLHRTEKKTSVIVSKKIQILDMLYIPQEHTSAEPGTQTLLETTPRQSSYRTPVCTNLIFITHLLTHITSCYHVRATAVPL